MCSVNSELQSTF